MSVETLEQATSIPVRRIRFDGEKAETDELLTREWIVTNGLGGYASGTVAGVVTRRFHGMLIAALPAPLGRRLMLAHLSEQVRLEDSRTVRLAFEEHSAPASEVPTAEYLEEFRLEAGLPVWRYRVGNLLIEKLLWMVHEQNTTFVVYKLLEGESVRMTLMPSMHGRNHEAPLNEPLPRPLKMNVCGDRFEWSLGEQLPIVRMRVEGTRPAFICDNHEVKEVLYRVEQRRGYDSVGALWAPGYFRVHLTKDTPVTLMASTEPWETLAGLSPTEAFRAELQRRGQLISDAMPAARSGVGAELVLAADQFLIRPASRVSDEARMHASGDQPRSIIAGYHWFTDWGRDTMISLEGLTLSTGRAQEARNILRTFAHYVHDGLIPNMFPEGQQQGLYHTADASLWFFHALDRYLHSTGDWQTLERLLPVMTSIAEHHLRGTRFGIGVDPADGLLRQGAPGYQLTWMDAKVDDWVVTPRRGKAVEINALWYNALRLLESWLCKSNDHAQAAWAAEHAENAYVSFNKRFWNESTGFLYDVIDGETGDDPACRPNQILAVSLLHPALEPAKWEAVVHVVRDRLLTPVGLRSLAPGEKDYQSKYDGDLRTRDAAYHQGTVWSWLLGPFLDAWLKVHPEDRQGARDWLNGTCEHLSEAGIGTISEIFDAEPPFTPRGCIAQAWSVAEALRCWVKTSSLEQDEDNSILSA